MIRFLFLTIGFLLCVGSSVLAQSAPGTAPIDARKIERPAEEDTDTPREEEGRSPLFDRIEQQRQKLQSDNVSFREIVIYGVQEDRIEINEALEALQLDTLEVHILNALESILVVTKGDQANMQTLRQQLPDAEIDWNDDLSASASPRLYAKDMIEWPGSETCVLDAAAVPIGLIDGRINRSHVAFADQTIYEKDFLNGENADMAHATAIASILIGNAPTEGFEGLLPGAKLYNAVALRNSPNDRQLASIGATLRGLDWLMGKDVRLINVSLAGAGNRVLSRAFIQSVERGSLIFAAAGNNGPTAPPLYPAAIEGVFAVTAIDARGRVYTQANQGDYIDYMAPGVDIWAAASDKNGGSYKSGTSYATPYALASTALFLTKNPNLSGALLKELLPQKITAHCP